MVQQAKRNKNIAKEKVKLSSRKRKRISIKTKLSKLEKFNKGLSVMEISRQVNFAVSTARKIKQNETKIEQCSENMLTELHYFI